MQNNVSRPRITLLDTLRGYALMGLFLVHMVEYFELYWYHPEPGWVNTLVFSVFGGKAYGMFALLFGVSFFIIMDSQSKKGVDFRLRFLWRITLLLAMGYIHGLVYGGDILQILAITGLFLVPLYHLRNRALLFIALFFVLQVPSLVAYLLVNALPDLVYNQPVHWTTQPPIFEIYAHGSFMEVLHTNLWRGQLGKWGFMIESGRLWNIIGLSVLGFFLGRAGFFVDQLRYKTMYLHVFAAAIGLTLFLSATRQTLTGLVPGTESQWIVENILTAWINHGFIAMTVTGLVLLYRLPVATGVLQLLAPCGRLTLTFYVAQSFIFVPVFYGYGAGAYAYIGQTLSFTLGIVLWCVQVWLARWWIRHYHYGPLEWLWRSATWLQTDIPFKRSHP